jgi:hypothetical protein
LTQFIAYQPKKYRSEKVLESKIKCVLDGASMSHWAALASRVPIVPFPCWTNKAKEISPHLPFSGGDTGTSDSEEMKDDQEEEFKEEIVKKRKMTKAETMERKRMMRESLPVEIMSLL